MKHTLSSIDPTDLQDIEILRSLVTFWMERCRFIEIERNALLSILSENGIDTTLKNLIDKMNLIGKNVK